MMVLVKDEDYMQCYSIRVDSLIESKFDYFFIFCIMSLKENVLNNTLKFYGLSYPNQFESIFRISRTIERNQYQRFNEGKR